MHTNALKYAQLPAQLPVFPLSGTLLLPGGLLPLNIFEPRYMCMVDDALATSRLIGMLLPSAKGTYSIGCAGRIINFAEHPDGRYTITLGGVTRFKVGQFLSIGTSYQKIIPEWSPYKSDMDEATQTLSLDRSKLKCLLKAFFDVQDMSCQWAKMDHVDDDELLATLAMICPLPDSEKQALLEAPNAQARADMFMTMLQMAVGEAHTRCCEACH